ncbi:hypothetical protein Ciccas_010797, partial [Cichlidogyrus casuarinus]
DHQLRRRERVEGPLFKFTNVLKGYQLRWFVLNTENGILEYHEVRIPNRKYYSLDYREKRTSPADHEDLSISQ